MMCHLALLENDGGETATWLEPVSAQEYQTAQQQGSQQAINARIQP
jgi:hypothetical protein